MSSQWVDCPEMVSPAGHLHQCRAPAEVILLHTVQSANGPTVRVKTRCALGHIVSSPPAVSEAA